MAVADRIRLRRHLLPGGAALAALFAVVLHTSAAAREQAPPAGTALAPRTADYDIDVTLDPATRTLTGRELVTWRNPGQVAAYSTRARAEATVSTPLAWEELGPEMRSGRFTVGNLLNRLTHLSDPWKDLRKRARRLPM